MSTFLEEKDRRDEPTPKVALMGRMRCGKDHVADLTGLVKVQLSQPFLRLMTEFFGDSFKKSDPGARRVMQQLGKIGRGIVSEDYPFSIERMNLIEMVRRIGPRLWGMENVDWDSFGKMPNFWTQAMMKCPPVYNTNPRAKNTPVIVPNCRYLEDVQDFEESGWDIYLVLCREETRMNRLSENGEKYDGTFPGTYGGFQWGRLEQEAKVVDYSEKLSTEISNYYLFTDNYPQVYEPIIPINRVIWNDSKEPPEESILSREEGWLRLDKVRETLNPPLKEEIPDREAPENSLCEKCGNEINPVESADKG